MLETKHLEGVYIQTMEQYEQIKEGLILKR